MSKRRTRQQPAENDEIKLVETKRRKRDTSEDMGCCNPKPEDKEKATLSTGEEQKLKKGGKKKSKYGLSSQCSILEGKVAELETKLASLEEDRDKYKNQNEEARNELEKVKREKAEELKAATKQFEENKAKATKASNERYEAMCLKVEAMDQKVKRRDAKLSEKEKELESASKAIKKLETKVAASVDELKKAKADNDRLLNRVSELAGAKLSAGNPNLVDISDENRPTKLAERYSELYDNEWTDAFAILSDRNHDDQRSIQILLQILEQIYRECSIFADEDLKNFESSVMNSFRYENNSADSIVLRKQYTDRRKKVHNALKAEVKPKIEARLKRISIGVDMKELQNFINETVDICLLMCIQDPPVYIEPVVGDYSEPFDTSKYKAYTSSGKIIEFVVWPPLYLHKDGSLLAKGVAQGRKELSKSKAPQPPGTEPVKTTAPNSGSTIEPVKTSTPTPSSTTPVKSPGPKSSSSTYPVKTSGSIQNSVTTPGKEIGPTIGSSDKESANEKKNVKQVSTVIQIGALRPKQQGPTSNSDRPKSDVVRGSGANQVAQSDVSAARSHTSGTRHSANSTVIWKDANKGAATYL